MPVGFRRHLVGKTLINVFHYDIAEIRFVGKLDIFVNQRFECYINSTINLRPLNLTPYIMPCYTHKMAIVSWPDSVTSRHPMYKNAYLILISLSQ